MRKPRARKPFHVKPRTLRPCLFGPAVSGTRRERAGNNARCSHGGPPSTLGQCLESNAEASGRGDFASTCLGGLALVEVDELRRL
ncbi:hypothetical protein MRX96_056126 [Rhipicephalus microplus]